jgi:hypothetical protein
MTWMVTRIEYKAVAGNPRDGFFMRGPMDYQAFTTGSLTLMYEAVRGALASDDAQEMRSYAAVQRLSPISSSYQAFSASALRRVVQTSKNSAC